MLQYTVAYGTTKLCWVLESLQVCFALQGALLAESNYTLPTASTKIDYKTDQNLALLPHFLINCKYSFIQG